MRRPPPKVIMAVVAVELVSAVLAWRDLSRRSDSRVRGSKRFWRVAMCANPGNSLGYWVLGRR